jgi:cation diffusion facilitator family transporter
MHTDSLGRWEHTHVFLGAAHARNERKTWIVIALTTAMMVGEIIGGSLFGSMALIADGLHMSTHAGALLIAALAYTFARRHARNSRFAFGSGKFGDLAAFTSAIVLAMIALLIGYEALQRLVHPVAIAFDQAIPVAALGLVVNLASAWLLRDDHHHADHRHVHGKTHHDHEGHHEGHHAGTGHRGHSKPHERDHNLRAAYIHVLADAATSVLAIVGLLAGWIYGWVFMDPVMGIVGALVIANWSYGLVRDAGAVLLDVTPDPSVAGEIRHRLELGDDRITDLHLWRVGPGHYGAIISIVTHQPKSPADYKARLASIAALAHVTVEVESCA